MKILIKTKSLSNFSLLYNFTCFQHFLWCTSITLIMKSKIWRKNNTGFTVKLLQFQRMALDLATGLGQVLPLSCLLTAKTGERRDHWVRLQGLFWELLSTQDGERAKCLTHRRSLCVLLTQGQKGFAGRFGQRGQDASVLGGSLAILPQEPGRRTLGPGSCFSEQAWDAALKDFGRSLPGPCDLCLSEPLVQSPLEIPDWFHWWITPATCATRGPEHWRSGESLEETQRIETAQPASVLWEVVPFPTRTNTGGKSNMPEWHLNLVFMFSSCGKHYLCVSFSSFLQLYWHIIGI